MRQAEGQHPIPIHPRDAALLAVDRHDEAGAGDHGVADSLALLVA